MKRLVSVLIVSVSIIYHVRIQAAFIGNYFNWCREQTSSLSSDKTRVVLTSREKMCVIVKVVLVSLHHVMLGIVARTVSIAEVPGTGTGGALASASAHLLIKVRPQLSQLTCS